MKTQHEQRHVEAGVMDINIGGQQQKVFVVGIPDLNKAIATTGLVSDEAHHDESIADAERIAACWNAFNGIPTEDFAGKSVGEYVGEQAYLKNIEVQGGLDIGLHGSACQVLAASFAGQFKANGATNYLEVQMEHPETGPLTITMQRVEGKTPGQLKSEMQTDLGRAKALLTDLLKTNPARAADIEEFLAEKARN